MSRRPARFTQADIARALRAARQEGAAGIKVEPDGSIIVLLTAPSSAPEPVDHGQEAHFD